MSKINWATIPKLKKSVFLKENISTLGMVAKNFVFCRPPAKMNRTKKLKKMPRTAKKRILCQTGRSQLQVRQGCFQGRAQARPARRWPRPAQLLSGPSPQFKLASWFVAESDGWKFRLPQTKRKKEEEKQHKNHSGW